MGRIFYFQKYLLVMFLLVCYPRVSFAAESEDAFALDEVIVTARKREETLQESPTSITAMTAEALRESGATNVRDLQNQVPGLSVTESESKNGSIYIRGVGQRYAGVALDPGVGVYINGIYIARSDSQLLDTVDTRSVEVLRGPQGTLFGKNNTGGAILVTTEMPYPDEFSGYFSTRLGSFGRRDAKVAANVPLDENLAMRVSLNSKKMDGYLENTLDGKDYGDEDRLAATADIYWEPGEIFSADLFTYWSKTNEQGMAANCFLGNPESTFTKFNLVTEDLRPGGATFVDRCKESARLAEKDKVSINEPSQFKMTSEIAALTLKWNFDDIEVKSITSLSRQRDIVIADDQDAVDVRIVANGIPALQDTLRGSLDNGHGNFTPPGPEKRQQFSQELQLVGAAFDEDLSYTLGLFYTKEDLDDTVYTQGVGYNGYFYIDYLGFSTIYPKFMGTHSDFNNDAYAAYAQASYDVTDWFQLTAGIRYTVEDRERVATSYGADCDAIIADGLFPGATSLCDGVGMVILPPGGKEAFLVNPPDYLPVELLAVTKGSKRFEKATPMITASFNIPEDQLDETFIDSSLIYLTWSTGFKAGGFEMRGIEMLEFDPETVNNYEIGWKMDAFDSRLRVNSAFYYMEYNDIQLRISETGAGPADLYQFISNAGKAIMQGFELEATSLLTENLMLSFSLNLTDAKYDEFTATRAVGLPPVQETVDRSHEPYAGVPESTYNIALSYNLLTSMGTFTPRLSVNYRDEIYTGTDFLSSQSETFNAGGPDEYTVDYEKISTISDVTLLDFRLTFVPEDEQFTLGLYANNLTDEKWFQGGFSSMEGFGSATYVQAPSRHYGLEFLYNFY